MNAAAQASPRALDHEFRRALRGFAATVSIVSARGSQGNAGITVTAVSSVSMEPPSLLVAINESSSMHAAMQEAERFCINVLGTAQVEHSRVFGSRMPMHERFETGDWRLSREDVPYLCEAQANIFCRKAENWHFGTHGLFVGVVERLALGDGIAPLLYLDGRYVNVVSDPSAIHSSFTKMGIAQSPDAVRRAGATS